MDQPFYMKNGTPKGSPQKKLNHTDVLVGVGDERFHLGGNPGKYNFRLTCEMEQGWMLFDIEDVDAPYLVAAEFPNSEEAKQIANREDATIEKLSIWVRGIQIL